MAFMSWEWSVFSEKMLFSSRPFRKEWLPFHWTLLLFFSFLSIFYWLSYSSFPNLSPHYPPPLSPLFPAPPNPPALPPLVHVHGLYIWVFFWVLCFLYHFWSLAVYLMPTSYASSSLYLSPYSSLPPPHWNPSMWCLFLWFCSCSSC